MSHQIVVVTEWRPNYKRACEVCSAKPTVRGYNGEQVVMSGKLCGPCLWGEAKLSDPDLWNIKQAKKL